MKLRNLRSMKGEVSTPKRRKQAHSPSEVEHEIKTVRLFRGDGSETTLVVKPQPQSPSFSGSGSVPTMEDERLEEKQKPFPEQSLYVLTDRMDAKSVWALGGTCRRLHDFLRSDAFWQRRYQNVNHYHGYNDVEETGEDENDGGWARRAIKRSGFSWARFFWRKQRCLIALSSDGGRWRKKGRELREPSSSRAARTHVHVIGKTVDSVGDQVTSICKIDDGREIAVGQSNGAVHVRTTEGDRMTLVSKFYPASANLLSPSPSPSAIDHPITCLASADWPQLPEIGVVYQYRSRHKDQDSTKGKSSKSSARASVKQAIKVINWRDKCVVPVENPSSISISMSVNLSSSRSSSIGIGIGIGMGMQKLVIGGGISNPIMVGFDDQQHLMMWRRQRDTHEHISDSDAGWTFCATHDLSFPPTDIVLSHTGPTCYVIGPSASASAGRDSTGRTDGDRDRDRDGSLPFTHIACLDLANSTVIWDYTVPLSLTTGAHPVKPQLALSPNDNLLACAPGGLRGTIFDTNSNSRLQSSSSPTVVSHFTAPEDLPVSCLSWSACGSILGHTGHHTSNENPVYLTELRKMQSRLTSTSACTYEYQIQPRRRLVSFGRPLYTADRWSVITSLDIGVVDGRAYVGTGNRLYCCRWDLI